MRPHILETLAIAVSKKKLGKSYLDIDEIKKEMNLAGFNNLAATLAVEQLIQDKFFDLTYVDTEYGQFPAISPTDKAVEWLLQNQDDFDFRVQDMQEKNNLLTHYESIDCFEIRTNEHAFYFWQARNRRCAYLS